MLAYLFEPGTAESRQNLDIAVNAVKGLVETEDRAVIPLLLARLGTEHPATSHLLRAMGDFDPAPDGWTTTLLAHTRLRNRDSVSAAWSALGNRRDADSIKAWVPLAVARLGSLETRASALSALRAGAGRTIVGLDALVDLAANAANIEDDRVSALEIIGQTASEAGANIDRQVAAAARPIWRRACDPVLAGPFGKRFEACAGRVIYIYQDNDERAPLLAAWLAGNSDVQAKLNLLPRIQATGTYSAAETVRRELAHPDPRVVKAAEATLDTIRPAWRESGARQERTGSASDASTRPAQEAAPSGPAADGAALFEAVRLGRVDEFKKTVNAGNAKTPVNYPGVTPNTPPPLGILVNYCYVRELTDSLAAMAEHLMSLGVNPDVVSQGENLLDRAKKACPPKIMQILSR